MGYHRFVTGMVILILIGGAVLLLAWDHSSPAQELKEINIVAANVARPTTAVPLVPTADQQPATAVPSPTPPTFPYPILGTETTITSSTPSSLHPFTPLPLHPLTPTIIPVQVNGLSLDQFIILPPEVVQHTQEIFANGQVWGRNARAFSKLGDSLIATPHFLTPFDEPGRYNLGEFGWLQPTIDYFSGSFKRYGVAVRAGLHAWGVFDPLWANKEWCEANENMLDCEIRLNNPSFLFVFLGSNDNGSAEGFDHNLRQIVETAVSHGVVPVLVTKADRFEGSDNRNNHMIRQIAADYQVPLWDFDAVANTLSGRGLAEDFVHLTTFPENDYTLPVAFERGYAMHNLTALMMLDALLHQVIEPGE